MDSGENSFAKSEEPPCASGVCGPDEYLREVREEVVGEEIESAVRLEANLVGGCGRERPPGGSQRCCTRGAGCFAW